MKISTSCFKVIRRTLQSDKNWLRYLSLGVISLVNYPSFEGDQFSSTARLSNPLWQNTKMCQKKNFEIRKGMTCRECASQKCSNLIDRKRVDFFAEHAGKIPSILPFYLWNRSFRECSFAILDPIFGRPPFGARISKNLYRSLTIPNPGLEMWRRSHD